MTIALFNSDMTFLGFADLDQEHYVKLFAKATTALPRHVTFNNQFGDDVPFEWSPSTYQGFPLYHELVTIEVDNLRRTA